MSKIINIWLDDIRRAPKGYIHCYTVEDAFKILNYEDEYHVSFDHDLGEEELTGYDLAFAFEQSAFTTDCPYKIVSWKIHSANPIGRDRIKMAMLSYARQMMRRAIPKY